MADVIDDPQAPASGQLRVRRKGQAARHLPHRDPCSAHGAGLLAAALVGGALALRAAGRLSALGLAGLLHRKRATLRELGFSHMYSAVVKAKRKRPEPLRGLRFLHEAGERTVRRRGVVKKRSAAEDRERAGGLVVADGAAVLTADAAFENGADALRIQLVLVDEAAVRKRIGIVGRQNGHDGLADDRTAVKHGRHEVNGRAVHAATRIDGALVRIEAGESGNKAG